jgi:hypothetical protein
VAGTDLTWSLPGIPAGQPDNATGIGQTLPVTLAPGATKLSLIGTATERGQNVTTTVNFTDGTSAPYAISYADWCQAPAAGTFLAVQTANRLKGTGTDSCRVSLFATAPFEIPAGKTVTSVTLPVQPGSPTREGRIHVFAIADNGAALKATAEADIKAKQNKAVKVTLGTVSGGTITDGAYKAGVAWGDGVTEDATVTVGADGVATLSGTHTWSKGTYTVRVLVSDERSDALITLTATIG